MRQYKSQDRQQLLRNQKGSSKRVLQELQIHSRKVQKKTCSREHYSIEYCDWKIRTEIQNCVFFNSAYEEVKSVFCRARSGWRSTSHYCWPLKFSDILITVGLAGWQTRKISYYFKISVLHILENHEDQIKLESVAEKTIVADVSYRPATVHRKYFKRCFKFCLVTS